MPVLVLCRFGHCLVRVSAATPLTSSPSGGAKRLRHSKMYLRINLEVTHALY